MLVLVDMKCFFNVSFCLFLWRAILLLMDATG